MCMSHDMSPRQSGICCSAAAVCRGLIGDRQESVESDLGAVKGGEGGSPALPRDPVRALAVQRPPLEAHACTNAASTVSALVS